MPLLPGLDRIPGPQRKALGIAFGLVSAGPTGSIHDRFSRTESAGRRGFQAAADSGRRRRTMARRGHGQHARVRGAASPADAGRCRPRRTGTGSPGAGPRRPPWPAAQRRTAGGGPARQRSRPGLPAHARPAGRRSGDPVGQRPCPDDPPALAWQSRKAEARPDDPLTLAWQSREAEARPDDPLTLAWQSRKAEARPDDPLTLAWQSREAEARSAGYRRALSGAGSRPLAAAELADPGQARVGGPRAALGGPGEGPRRHHAARRSGHVLLGARATRRV